MEVGTLIDGKLRVERVLGRGGMGVVVAATHLLLRQQVAVKVLRDELASDPATVERFLREAQACAQLRSEHVCRVFDVGTLASGAPYLVMELLAGSDLAAAVSQRPLGIAEAVEAVRQACEAIGEAHAVGIVHRDLKPANLFVTRRPDGSAMIKVLDFGIAKTLGDDMQLTQTAAFMGSPVYMSPEQLRSARDVDARTDIWSLGVILYQCVSGALPFPATTITELVAKVLSDPPQPLRIEPRFDAVVMRCLEKDRDRRYPTVGALVHALLALDPAAAARPGSRMTPVGLAATAVTYPPALAAAPASRSPRSLAIGIGAAVLALIAIAIAARGRDSAPVPDRPVSAAGGSSASLAARSGTDGSREGAFGRAMFDRRCDDALVIARTLSDNHVEQAKGCIPRRPSTKVYPETLEGAAEANLDGEFPRAFAIAEKLIAKSPDDPHLIQLMGLLGCQLDKPAVARRNVPRIADAEVRAVVVETCRVHGITMP